MLTISDHFLALLFFVLTFLSSIQIGLAQTVSTPTSSDETAQTSNFKIKGYIWNSTLKLWWRTDCSLPLIDAPDCVSLPENKVIYNHDTGSVSGNAYSSTAGVLPFGAEIPECPTKTSINGQKLRGVKLIKLPFSPGSQELYGSNDEGIRFIGCINIFYTPILLSPYNEDGSLIEGVHRPSGWNGVWGKPTVEPDEEGFKGHSIRFANCGLALPKSENSVNLEWWSFGENNTGENKFITDSCYRDRNGSLVSSEFVKTEALNASKEVYSFGIVQNKIKIGQIVSFVYNCGDLRTVDKTDLSPEIGRFLTNDRSGTFDIVATRNLRSWSRLVGTENILVCKDSRGFFLTQATRTKPLSLITSAISQFLVDRDVISVPSIVGASYSVQNFDKTTNLNCELREVGLNNEKAILAAFQVLDVNFSGKKEIPLLKNANFTIECVSSNTDDPVTTSPVRSVRYLPSSLKERTISKEIKTPATVIKLSNDVLKIDKPEGADEVHLFTFDAEAPSIIRFSLVNAKESKIINLNANYSYLKDKPFYTLPYNTETKEEGPKFRYIHE